MYSFIKNKLVKIKWWIVYKKQIWLGYIILLKQNYSPWCILFCVTNFTKKMRIDSNISNTIIFKFIVSHI